jgi:hypothetical protein
VLLLYGAGGYESLFYVLEDDEQLELQSWFSMFRRVDAYLDRYAVPNDLYAPLTHVLPQGCFWC